VHLKDLKNLKELSLKQTDVTDAGLAHLHSLTGLRKLNCGGTGVTPGGLKSLRQALPNLQP
jgi:hypothetical protein